MKTISGLIQLKAKKSKSKNYKKNWQPRRQKDKGNNAGININWLGRVHAGNPLADCGTEQRTT